MRSIITMTKKEAERYDIIQRLIKKEIDGTQASKLINLSVRQTKRIKAKVLKIQKNGGESIRGVIHGNRGKESKKKIPQEKRDEIAELKQTNYSDFSTTLFKEKLEEIH